MKTIAVYAGTFDPITFGHIDVIERAIQLFPKVIVAIAASPNKKPLFTVAERVQLASQVLQDYPTVEIKGFDGLLLNFVHEHHANVLLRGLRAVADFDYEFQLASMNRFMNPQIESLFLMPSEKYMYISASMVREIASLGGNVEGFVPSLIAEELYKKFPKDRD
jgi:pantetheine-phosphate adenylyltransferase